MEIKSIEKKEEWEDFLLECNEKTFLQSWNWGEFQWNMGNKIWRLGTYEDNELISVALIVKVAAKRGTFLFCPHGPIVKSKIKNRASIYGSEGEEEDKVLFAYQKLKILEILLNTLKEIAQGEKASFIRIAPVWERSEENIEIFKNLGFREAPIHIHPEITWELDITPSEEDLLMKMRKTTRYLIRQAQKNEDLKIEISQKLDYNPPTTLTPPSISSKEEKLDAIEVFNKLYQEVAQRQHFVPFSLDYLKNEFLAFLPDNQILLFLGKYKNEIITSGIFIFWQNIAFYHHGATSLKHPKIPTSYSLQWKAIREAKRRGCKIFNFWGIAPLEKKFHPWVGLTLFKMGFGGQKKEYIKTQDLPLSKKYWLTYIFEKLRKTKRGL